MISVRYKLSLAEMIKAGRMSTIIRSKSVYILTVIIYLIFLVSSIFWMPSKIGSSIYTFLIVLPLSFIYQYFYVIPYRCRRIFKEWEESSFEHDITIYPEYYESRLSHGKITYKLSRFKGYKLSKDMVVLLEEGVTSELIHTFPRRVFTSGQDYGNFLSYLETNIGRPK